MPLVILNGPIIAAGESLSDAIDCTAGRVVRITMSADWSDAPLTFQLSSDGFGFNNLFDPHAKEIIFEVQPGSAVLVPAGMASALAHLKFRSGLADHPVKQSARREFSIALETPEAP